MAYSPQTLTNLVPPIATTASGYTTPWDNHDAIFEAYTGHIATHMPKEYAYTSTSKASVWRFTSWCGFDWLPWSASSQGLRLRVKVLATGTGSGGTVFVEGSTYSASAAVSGARATYTIDVQVDTEHETWTIDLQAAAASSVVIHSWSAQWLPVRGNAAFPSGYRQGWSGWKAANAPVHTEGIGRLITGPTAIAADRPACVFGHFAKIGFTLSGKTKGQLEEVWGREDQDFSDTVGRGLLPRCDVRPRKYRVLWYLQASASGTGSITVGGQVIAVSTANAWGQAQIELTQGDHAVLAQVNPGTGEQAYFQAIQIFRSEQ